jgi:hypothetical protein
MAAPSPAHGSSRTWVSSWDAKLTKEAKLGRSVDGVGKYLIDHVRASGTSCPPFWKAGLERVGAVKARPQAHPEGCLDGSPRRPRPSPQKGRAEEPEEIGGASTGVEAEEVGSGKPCKQVRKLNQGGSSPALPRRGAGAGPREGRADARWRMPWSARAGEGEGGQFAERPSDARRGARSPERLRRGGA